MQLQPQRLLLVALAVLDLPLPLPLPTCCNRSSSFSQNRCCVDTQERSTPADFLPVGTFSLQGPSTVLFGSGAWQREARQVSRVGQEKLGGESAKVLN